MTGITTKRGSPQQGARTPINNIHVVLVAVLKNKRDRRILLKKHWYRIPCAFAPKRRFAYIAFYQSLAFGRHGKRIELYGRIRQIKKVQRIALLPKEKFHPRIYEGYFKIEFSHIQKLAKPIKNIIPRRVSFGFTTLHRLLTSKHILQLYGVPATEQIIAKRLLSRGISTRKEYTISKSGKRVRLDLAIFCARGNIGIECDNRKAHANKTQKQKDRTKNIFLKRLGWHVIRLKEKSIIEHPDRCAQRVEKKIHSLGGLS